MMAVEAESLALALTAAAAALTLLYLSTAAYAYLRRLVPANVNCHFCCGDFRVPYEDRNSWTCPACHQYNGFDKDGDYNRDTVGNPEHYETAKPSNAGVRFCSTPASSKKVKDTANAANNNGLCDTCNLNQDLKVHQLRTFEPKNPDKYDEEIAEYEAHLERAYRLCRYCEASLHQTLGKQDSWLKPKLLSWKLEKNRQSPLSTAKKQSSAITGHFAPSSFVKRLVTNAYLLGLSTACWVVAVTSMESDFLSDTLPRRGVAPYLDQILAKISGLSSPTVEYYLLAATLISHAYCVKFDLDTFWNNSTWRRLKLATLGSWILHCTLTSSSRIFSVPVEEALIFMNLTLGLAGVVNLIVLPNWHQHKQNLVPKPRHNMADRPLRAATLGNFGEWQIPEATNDQDEVRSQDLVSENTQLGSFGSCPQGLSATDGVNGWAFSPEADDLSISNNSESGGGGECDLSVLKIQKGHDDKRPVSPSSTFSLKKYESFNSSGINFGDLPSSSRPSSSQQHHPIVKPPKFVSPRAAQSSWVAGGYWSPPSGKFGSRGSSFVNRTPYLGGGSPSAGLFQFGIPTVSRCSSQSSGFGSIGKGANPFDTHGNPGGGAATTSLSGQRGVNNANFNSDFDRFSVVSEPPPELNSRHTLPRSRSKPSASNSTFSLGQVNGRLAFYDVTSTPSQSRLSMASSKTFLAEGSPQSETSLRVRRRRRSSGDSDHCDTPIKKCPTLLNFNPKANSSPKENFDKKQSILNKKIHIDVSVYTLIMAASVAVNVGLTLAYVFS